MNSWQMSCSPELAFTFMAWLVVKGWGRFLSPHVEVIFLLPSPGLNISILKEAWLQFLETRTLETLS